MEYTKPIPIWPLLHAVDRDIWARSKYFAILEKGDNAFVVTTNNEVYSIGINGESGPLGIGVCTPAVVATRIEELSGKEVKNIVGCEGIECRIVLLTRNHEIYSWGDNKFKALGYELSEKNVMVPRQVNFSKKFIKVAIGSQHTTAVTHDFRVYAWGYNGNGQLGTGNKNSSASPIESGNGQMGLDVAVRDVSCGLFNTYYITASNQIYSVGCAEYGALGSQTEEDDTPDTVPLAIENVEFRKIIAGGQFAFAISTEDVAYSWGRNDKYQLGIDGAHVIPAEIGIYDDIGTHCDCNLAGGITDKGIVYVWGETRYGTLKEPLETPLKKIDDIFIVYTQSRTYRLVQLPTLEVTAEAIDIELGEVIYIHPKSCHEDGIPIEWYYLETNSMFFRILINTGHLTMEVKDYVLLGFDTYIVNIYIEYLKTKSIDSSIGTEDLQTLIELSIVYREWKLLEYIIMKFSIFPQINKRYTYKLTVENVCVVYQQALENDDMITKELCLRYIVQHLLPVFTSISFLAGIKCETMRSIMQELASRYKEMFTQIAKSHTRKDGEGIAQYYPEILIEPSQTGQHIREVVRQIALERSIDRLEYVINHVEKVTKEIGAEYVTYKCITLPQPGVQCYVM